MFGIVIDWPDVKRQLRQAFGVLWAGFAGIAFMAMAMVSIEYEEVIAPGVSRISGACSAAAQDFGRKLSSTLAL